MTFALCTFPNVLGTPDALYGNDTTQNIDWILPLQDGLRIIHNFDTKVITGQWTVLVTLDTPVVPTDFFDFVSKLRSRLVAPAVAMSTSFRDESERRLDQAENMITQPQDWYSHSTGTKRSKRGLFNLVGHGLQFLFGTARESEVRDARYRIKNSETVSDRFLFFICKHDLFLKDCKQQYCHKLLSYIQAYIHTYMVIYTRDTYRKILIIIANTIANRRKKYRI